MARWRGFATRDRSAPQSSRSAFRQTLDPASIAFASAVWPVIGDAALTSAPPSSRRTRRAACWSLEAALTRASCTASLRLFSSPVHSCERRALRASTDPRSAAMERADLPSLQVCPNELWPARVARRSLIMSTKLHLAANISAEKPSPSSASTEPPNSTIRFTISSLFLSTNTWRRGFLCDAPDPE